MTRFVELIERCKSRDDGLWELLAAPAGNVEAHQRIAGGLSRQELEKGRAGTAISPHRVQLRVESLASYDRGQLAKLARIWPSPGSLSEDSALDAFFLEAWRTALRHLHAIKEVPDGALTAPALQRESAVLLLKSVEKTSWKAINADYAGSPGRFTPDAVTKLSKANLDEKVLTSADLQLCLDQTRVEVRGNVTTAKTPLYLLRILRGKAGILDNSARKVIESLLSHLENYTAIENAVLIELVGELGLDFRDLVAEKLAQQLVAASSPLAIAFPFYVLLGKGWTVL